MTFIDGLVDLFTTPIALVAVLILTVGFALTVALTVSPKAKRFMLGIIPFTRPRDEEGNPCERSIPQWICMMVLICFILALIML